MANRYPEYDNGVIPNPKDRVEDAAKGAVCDGKMSLATAQKEIASNWITLGQQLGVTSSNPQVKPVVTFACTGSGTDVGYGTIGERSGPKALNGTWSTTMNFNQSAPSYAVQATPGGTGSVTCTVSGGGVTAISTATSAEGFVTIAEIARSFNGPGWVVWMGNAPHATPAPPSAAAPAPTSVPAPASTAAPAPPASSGGCLPLTPSGTCYRPGEYCSDAEHGESGIGSGGVPITCEPTGSRLWHWETS